MVTLIRYLGIYNEFFANGLLNSASLMNSYDSRAVRMESLPLKDSIKVLVTSFREQTFKHWCLKLLTTNWWPSGCLKFVRLSFFFNFNHINVFPYQATNPYYFILQFMNHNLLMRRQMMNVVFHFIYNFKLMHTFFLKTLFMLKSSPVFHTFGLRDSTVTFFCVVGTCKFLFHSLEAFVIFLYEMAMQ